MSPVLILVLLASSHFVMALSLLSVCENDSALADNERRFVNTDAGGDGRRGRDY